MTEYRLIFRIMYGKKLARVRQKLPINVQHVCDPIQDLYSEKDKGFIIPGVTTIPAIALYIKYYVLRKCIPEGTLAQTILDFIKLCVNMRCEFNECGIPFSIAIPHITYDYWGDSIYSDRRYVKSYADLQAGSVKWTPATHKFYSDDLRECVMTFLLCVKRVYGVPLAKDVLGYIFSFVEERPEEDIDVVVTRNLPEMNITFQKCVILDYLDDTFGTNLSFVKGRISKFKEKYWNCKPTFSEKWENFAYEWPALAYYIWNAAVNKQKDLGLSVS